MFPHAHVSLPALPRTGSIREPAAQRSALLGAWSGVHVGPVELRRLPQEESSAISVEACVALAGLLPADVRVELIPPRELAGAEVRRMCSICSYANGTFRFATTLAAAQMEESRDWLVRVSPADALRPSQDVQPVTRRFVPRDFTA